MQSTINDHDLLVRVESVETAVKLACELPASGGPERALVHSFRGRDLQQIESEWRVHLGKLPRRTGQRPVLPRIESGI